MSIVLRILLLLLVVFLITHCSKNAKNANGGRANTMSIDTSRPGDPASIEGDDPADYLVYKRNLDYLQTIDPPQMRMVYRNSVVTMPAGAKDVVKTHWKAAIAYYYNDYFDKPKDASEMVDREDKWEKFCRETDKKLEDVSVTAPDGSRYINSEESRAIRNFLNEAAVRLINKAKAVEIQ
jgi:hypothetical protein